MKKLLEILGTITIVGSGVLTLVANSPVSAKKQQTKLESSDINYLQTNNLENLKRNKRQNNRILDINENLIINENEKEKYKSSMEKIISLLVSNNILRIIFESGEDENNTIYELNLDQKRNYDYFTIPVSIIQRDGTETTITLVFRIRDLYLQGFINNNHYYHFQRDRENSLNDDLINYPNINNANTNDLGYTGHYNNLMGETNHAIYWQSILDAFFQLSNIGTSFESQNRVVQGALGRIVLATSEVLRFRSIHNLVINNIINNNADGPIYWNPEENSGQVNVRNIVTNWQTISNNIIDLINNIQSIFGVEVDKESIFDKGFYNLLSKLPINMLAQILRMSTVRIIIGLILQPKLNCGKKTRSINNDIKNKYCDAVKGQHQNYPLENSKITAIKILDEDTKGGDKQAGDVYVGTTHGMYLIRNKDGSVLKYRGDYFDSIVDIKLDGNGGAVVLTNENGVFHLGSNGLSSKLEDIKSSNWEKEIKLYYDNKQGNHVVYFAPAGSNITNFETHTFNLGPLNPILNYNKIEFLGDVNDGLWGAKVSWGSWNYTDISRDYAQGTAVASIKGKNIVDLLKERNNRLKTVILNKKVVNQKEAAEVAILNVQDFQDSSSGWIGVSQKLGFTWYWENDNYYLQVIVFQQLDWRASLSSLEGWLKIGSGVRLYND